MVIIIDDTWFERNKFPLFILGSLIGSFGLGFLITYAEFGWLLK